MHVARTPIRRRVAVIVHVLRVATGAGRRMPRLVRRILDERLRRTARMPVHVMRRQRQRLRLWCTVHRVLCVGHLTLVHVRLLRARRRRSVANIWRRHLRRFVDDTTVGRMSVHGVGVRVANVLLVHVRRIGAGRRRLRLHEAARRWIRVLRR